MNGPTNISQIFNKLNDLKAVFVYGERLIPILQSLMDFIKDTVPLLENINHSIADSTSKLPKVANQISSVSIATELATTEILDLVDNVNNEISNVEKTLHTLVEKNEQKDLLQEKLSAMLKDNHEAKELFNQYLSFDDLSKTVNPLFKTFEKIKDDAYNITISLQVQDITSQQLAAVTHLMESVQKRLSTLVQDLEDSAPKTIEPDDLCSTEAVTFDPLARYSKDPYKQEQVDSIIKSELKSTTQAEIDKLFS